MDNLTDPWTPELQAAYEAYMAAQAADDLEHKAWLAANPDFNGDPDPQKF